MDSNEPSTSALQKDSMSDVEPSSDSEIDIAKPLVIDESMASEADSVVVAESQKWQTAKGKKPAKKQAEKSEAVVVAAEDKKGQKGVSQTHRTVFVRGGTGTNFVRDVAFKNAVAFKEAIRAVVGTVESLQVVNGSIKVVCQTEQQVMRLLKTTSLLDKHVITSLPRKLQPKGAAPGKVRTDSWKKGVLKRVPLHVTEEHIALDSGACWVHRITRGDGVSRRPTRAVIVAFTSELPTTVSIGLVNFHVHAYVPLPLRCTNCQRYGHKTKRCQACAPVCAKCSGSHKTPDCKVTEKEALKFPNCGEHHSAAYRGCKRFQNVEKTLKIASKQRMSYADAARKVALNQRKARQSSQKPAASSSAVPTTAAKQLADGGKNEATPFTVAPDTGNILVGVAPGEGRRKKKRNRKSRSKKVGQPGETAAVLAAGGSAELTAMDTTPASDSSAAAPAIVECSESATQTENVKKEEDTATQTSPMPSLTWVNEENMRKLIIMMGVLIKATSPDALPQERLTAIKSTWAELAVASGVIRPTNSVNGSDSDLNTTPPPRPGSPVVEAGAGPARRSS
jgi:hypothetical protein